MKALPIDYLKDIENDVNLVVGRKWDGFSEIITIRNGEIRLFNKSGREHTANVPSLTLKRISAPDCDIQAEGVGPDGRINSSKSILGSHPEHAIEFQRKHGPLKLVCHNLSRLRSESLEQVRFGEKIPFLAGLIEELRGHGLTTLVRERLMGRGKYEYFKEIIAAGGEGVVIKNLKGFDADMAKVKRVRTWDVVIVGFTTGRGKYSEVVGAIKYGAFKEGKLVEIGKCSGMTDEERIMFATAPQSYLGHVIELKGQEVGSGGRIRFPAFQRIREDKLPEECLVEHLVN